VDGKHSQNARKGIVRTNFERDMGRLENDGRVLEQACRQKKNKKKTALKTSVNT
jgi:hypothetical protein